MSILGNALANAGLVSHNQVKLSEQTLGQLLQKRDRILVTAAQRRNIYGKGAFKGANTIEQTQLTELNQAIARKRR